MSAKAIMIIGVVFSVLGSLLAGIVAGWIGVLAAGIIFSGAMMVCIAAEMWEVPDVRND